MSRISDAEQVAVVGSPSSNYSITLDLLDSATHAPLVGQMLFLVHTLNEGQRELALGTVTEVTTQNQWHTNPMLRGVVKTRGNIPGMSGDVGDVRAATVRLQACYKTPDPQADHWVQSGPSLRMSPATGTAIRQVTNDVVDELMSSEPDLHYLGHLHDTDVRAPLSIKDFSGPSGAAHAAIFGQSGSGKTAQASYLFAAQMRHRDHGMIIIDPQGQFASESGLPFSLQGWAAELGREVVVRRVAEDIRLKKDAPLLCELLGKTRFTRAIIKMGAETADILLEEAAKILRAHPTWDTDGSETLLRHIITNLAADTVLKRIYAEEKKQTRLADRLQELLDSDVEFAEVLRQFTPIHNLFAPTNPGGGTRHSMWGTIAHVFDVQARNGGPAPLLILDMSTSGQVSWINDLLADDERADMLDALRILDQDSIKAAILRQACRTLKTASEDKFRAGETLNTMVVFDEAWRYAPPPHNATDEEIKALSTDLAGYARDTRKFGIGWTFITQTPRSLNAEIWDQLSVRVIGYGLGGNELAKVAEQLDDPDHLKLYKGFSHPESTRPRRYPFMVMGPVSPLAFTKAPIFIDAYTDFDTFRADNHEWISAIRMSLGLPLLTGTPQRPGGTMTPTAVRSPVRNAAAPSGSRTLMGKMHAQAERVRANRDTGGVDPHAGVGLSTDTGFSGGLDAIDDEPPF